MTQSSEQPGGFRLDSIRQGSMSSGRTDIHELALDLYLLEGFGNVGVAVTGEGVVVIDTGAPGSDVLARLRQVTQEPVRAIIYTHGHADHAANAGRFLHEAAERGDPRPTILAHTNVAKRMSRYAEQYGLQAHINRIQFRIPEQLPAFPPDVAFVRPDMTYETSMKFRLGRLSFELCHALGETDDATWVYVPERRAIFSGDLVISSCPNIGNPLKVQRYEVEWAEALERMAALHAEVLSPGHGSLLRGEAVEDTLLATARALRYLHDEVVRRMNLGQWEEQIVSEVALPPDLAAHPALAPIYGSPAFIVHAIYRRYGGWYDGNPTHLSPARFADVAREVALIAGVESLLQRAEQLSQAGKHQLALHLLDFVIEGVEDADVKQRALYIKAAALEHLAAVETSFISRSILSNSAERIKKQSISG